jgi:thiamine biosynthesis lipoprotein ApbE
VTATASVHWVEEQRLFGAARYQIRLASEYAEHLQVVARAVWNEVERIERWLARDRAGSVVRYLNNAATRDEVTIDYEMVALLEDCQRWYRRTGGFFSAAAGRPLPEHRQLDIHSGETGLPYAVDAKRRTVRFLDPDFQLDLVGYAQAYALDCASHVLLQFAVFSGCLTAGPLCLAVGQQPSGEPWIAEVPNFISGPGAPPIGQLGLVECALFTAPSPPEPGPVREMATEHGGHGRAIPHPPATPPGSPSGSCTVIAPTAVDAHVLGTALAGMRFQECREFARALLGNQDGISVGWASRNGRGEPIFEWLVA